jgi:hypothetical protein
VADIFPTLNLIDGAMSSWDDPPETYPLSRSAFLIGHLSAGVAHGATQLEPILSAIRDHGVDLCFIYPDENILVSGGIAVLTDVLSHEPHISRYPTLQQYLTTCWGVYLVPGQPATHCYSCAAFDAVHLRQNVLIVETHLSRVSQWRDIVLAANQDLWVTVEIPETHGRAH